MTLPHLLFVAKAPGRSKRLAHEAFTGHQRSNIARVLITELRHIAILTDRDGSLRQAGRDM